MVSIFISHSSKDKVLVEKLIQLLHLAFLTVEEIRATSVPGYGLPGGSSTDDHLRTEINDAVVVVGLISQASVRSSYVIFELGARWGSRKPMVPLLAPGFDPSQLEGPLRGINCLDASSASHLHQFLQELSGHLKTPLGSAAAVQRQIDDIVALGKQLANPPRQQTPPQSKKPQNDDSPPSSPPDLEKEISSLARILRPLPDSHIRILRSLSTGPQALNKRSPAKDSLLNLKLIRLIGAVNSDHNLYEAISEEVLAEYFRRQRAQQLPGLLSSISPEEREFFNLFLLEHPFQQLANAATGILPSHFYYAGRSLQSKELLILAAEKDYVQTLTLPEDVARLAPEILGKPLRRTEVQFDLHKVAASNDSGGA